MRQLFIIILSTLIIQLSAQDVYQLDKTHSKMTFTVTHLGMSEIDGIFKDYEATITTSTGDFSDAVFSASADLTTMTTNHPGRDGHLQKDDMFDTTNHPKLKFASTSIRKLAEGKFKLTGDLTIKGITKSVELDLVLLGTGEHRRSKKPMAGFKVTGIVNRSDFGVGNMPSLVVGHDVMLSASGEFIQQ